jgi:hypothetical protein
MRWFWRADLPTVALDALLEGSLVGLVYLTLTTVAKPATPVPIFAFWLTAAVGLGLARLTAHRLRLEDSIPLLVVLAGVAGWYIDREVGWLLGAAFLRGALHVDSEHESDVAVDAVAYSLPVITLAMLVHLASGAGFGGQVLVTALVCIVAGMLSIGRGREREFGSLGPVAHQKRFWPVVGGGLAVSTAVAVPAAYLVGSFTVPLLLGPARALAAASRPLLEAVGGLLEWLLWEFAQLLPTPGYAPLPTPTPTPVPTRVVVPPPGQMGEAGTPIGLLLWSLLILTLAVAFLGAVVILSLVAVREVFAWRRAVARAELPEPPPSASGPPPSPLARVRRRLATPARLRPRPARRRAAVRTPTSAVEAYLDVLDELADVDDLARLPTETPLDHARRVGEGLEPIPLSLLAADYELATYAKVEITAPETARALERWRRLREAIERFPPPG